jgi:hypothetical protein
MGAVPGNFSRRKESQAPGPREIEVNCFRYGMLPLPLPLIADSCR